MENIFLKATFQFVRCHCFTEGEDKEVIFYAKIIWANAYCEVTNDSKGI